MQLPRPRLTYANVVATIALFLALCGGAAYAASTIRSGDIAPGAVRTSDVHKRAITSGKLAVGAVRGNQIAPDSVGSHQIAPGSIGGSEIAPGSIRPDQLEVPISLVAQGGGGAQALTQGMSDYPLSHVEWTQHPGELNLVMVEMSSTFAWNGSSINGCRFILDLGAGGRQIGRLELVSDSTQIRSEGASVTAPLLAPSNARANGMTASVIAQGCAPGSQIDSVEVQVLGIG
jgi:hypothetical protein